MEPVSVSTKEELKSAMESGVGEIVVQGKLASDLKKTKKIAKLSGAALAAVMALGAVGAGSVALAPATGGVSFFVAPAAAAPVAALTGMEIAAIICAVALGVSLIIAVFKDYEEISFDGEKKTMTLRKKQRT